MSTTIDSIHQLEAGIAALAEEDTAALSDAALAELIDQLAAMLSELDAYVTRMANTVLARNFTVSEIGTS
jgi:outer membrane murein-binding lipoprotein Lpp